MTINEIQKLMEAEAVKQMGRSNEEQHTETPIQTEQNMTSTTTTITSAKTAIMFDGLIDLEEDEEDDNDEGGENNFDKDLRDMANEELDRFNKIQILPLVNRDGL